MLAASQTTQPTEYYYPTDAIIHLCYENSSVSWPTGTSLRSFYSLPPRPVYPKPIVATPWVATSHQLGPCPVLLQEDSILSENFYNQPLKPFPPQTYIDVLLSHLLTPLAIRQSIRAQTHTCNTHFGFEPNESLGVIFLPHFHCYSC